MRMMMKVSIDTETGNKGIKDGSLPKAMQAAAEEIKPESSYFYAEKGRRTAVYFFDMKTTSQIPTLVEPLFAALKAEIEIFPVMNQEELGAGLKAWASRNS